MTAKKEKFDMLETFFIVETSKLLGLYDQIKNSDPRAEKAVTGEVSQEDELAIVKHSWAALVSYAQIYGYERFKTVDPDLEKFYLEKINVQH
jgi:hypothetical protein